MRLWSLHPKYLDRAGLLAVWREGLLAQKVLLKKTKGYTKHPQLIRFQREMNPAAAIGAYLVQIYTEAKKRGYHFNRKKIHETTYRKTITCSSGQVEFEWEHLKRKIWKRDTAVYNTIRNIKCPVLHPLFTKKIGAKERWEKS